MQVTITGNDNEAARDRFRDAWRHLLSDRPADLTVCVHVEPPSDVPRPRAPAEWVEGRAVVPDADAALEALGSLVTEACLTAQQGRLTMMHAAGLATPGGDVIALVAASGTGKTTAARTLAGELAYVTDETVAVAPDQSVVPHAKPLSVITPGHRHKVQHAPEALGLRVASGPLRLGAIVVLDRDPDHPGDPMVENFSTVRALVELAPHVSYLGVPDRPLHRLADVVVRTGGLRRVRYAEAATLAPVVAELLGGSR